MTKEYNALGIKAGSSVLAGQTETGLQIIATAIHYPAGEGTISLPGASTEPTIGEQALRLQHHKRPVRKGVIPDEEGIRHLIDIIAALDIPENPTVVLATPAIQDTRGIERLKTAIKQATCVQSIYMYPEALCQAAEVISNPAFKPIWQELQAQNRIPREIKNPFDYILRTIAFILNCGSTTTETACYNEGNMECLIPNTTHSGNRADYRIRQLLSNKMGSDAIITDEGIRQAKEQFSFTNPQPIPIQAFSNGGTAEIDICEEVRQALTEYAIGVAAFLHKTLLNDIPETTRNNIIHNKLPILQSGGMSNIEGMSELIHQHFTALLGIDIPIIHSPGKVGHTAPATGAYQIAKAIIQEEEAKNVTEAEPEHTDIEGEV